MELKALAIEGTVGDLSLVFACQTHAKVHLNSRHGEKEGSETATRDSTYAEGTNQRGGGQGDFRLSHLVLSLIRCCPQSGSDRIADPNPALDICKWAVFQDFTFK